MRKVGSRLLVLILFPTLLLADVARFPLGKWGGAHIKMVVAEKGATLKLECASGEIGEPLLLDSNRHFTVTGKIKSQIGPIEVDHPPSPAVATFNGVMQGNSLTLTVSYTDFQAHAHFDTYSLSFGDHGWLDRVCAL